MSAQPTVIFIAAHSRSGSTLLERLLGQHQNYFPLGEVRYIWHRSVIEDQLCGCGKVFSRCDFWSEVLKDAYGSVSKKDAEHNKQVFKGINSRAKLPLILFQTLQPESYKALLKEWQGVMSPLYESISKISGAKYLIDSSKTPTYGLLLSQILPQDALFVLHLVRDPRAVAYSRIRKKVRPEIHWKKEFMGITPPYKTAFQWLTFNILCEVLSGRTRSMCLRYEDLMESPNESLESVVGEIGGATANVDYVSENTVHLDLAHTTSGNPVRFVKGEMQLKQDTEWLSKFGLLDNLVVSSVNLPYLYKYNYR